MGNLVDFFIKVDEVSDEEFLDIIERVNNFHKVNIYYGHDFGTYAKWYNYKQNIAYVSKLYPKALFTIDCTGEEGDKWRVYIQDGKYQDAEAYTTYDEFDTEKLKKVEF